MSEITTARRPFLNLAGPEVKRPACTIAALPLTVRMCRDVIDQLREQIQQRLDQLAGEVDRLRKALAALDPRSPSRPAPRAAARTAPAPKRARSATPVTKAPTMKSAPPPRTSRPPAPATRRRTARGATKASVLAALAGGEALTAGQVAEKTGLARGTVSTTLSKLAQSGEPQKAERGYRIAPAAEPVPAPSSTPAE